MSINSNYMFFALLSSVSLIWAGKEGLTTNLTETEIESSLPNIENLLLEEHLPQAIPQHQHNPNIEQDLKELYKDIKKDAKNKGIYNKNKASLQIEGHEGALGTPQGIAIFGNELNLDNTVSNVKKGQATIDSNMYCYKSIPHHQGVWELIDINKINLKGKRVALVVHGHNTNSLYNALSTYYSENCFITQLGKLINCIKDQKEIEKTKTNNYYGLDVLVNLGRMLYQDIYDSQGKLRYDYVIGYAYSSWGKIKDFSRKFTQDINESGLQKAKYVDLFAHSMGGLMTRWALEQEGLGKWIHNCVFIASPHQGIPFCLFPGIIDITPSELFSTTDMVTRGLDLDEDASDFLKELTFTKSDYSASANYHTLSGIEYKTLTWGALKEGEQPTPHDLCPGVIVQKYLDCRFGKGKIPCDGLVPVYSAHSEYLSNKSFRYNNPDSYNHKAIVSADHRTIVGDDLQPTLFSMKELDTHYKQTLNVLQGWIQCWPL